MRFLAHLLTAAILASCTASPTAVMDMSVAVQNPRFGDSDPVDWAGQTPWQYPVHGIDVSKYQGDIDWQKARTAGVAFAFIKATEGGDHIDPNFLKNWNGAALAGMPRGAYHFYYFCRTAAEQAKWFIRNVPRQSGSLPPVLDMEWNHVSKTCKKRPAPHKIRSEMRTYLDRVEAHYKKRAILYTTVDFFRHNELWRIKGHEFWLRSVAGHPSKVYPRQGWAFWQYTGTGKIPGIEGDTDINVFAGSTNQWNEWVKAKTQ